MFCTVCDYIALRQDYCDFISYCLFLLIFSDLTKKKTLKFGERFCFCSQKIYLGGVYQERHSISAQTTLNFLTPIKGEVDVQPNKVLFIFFFLETKAFILFLSGKVPTLFFFFFF